MTWAVAALVALAVVGLLAKASEASGFKVHKAAKITSDWSTVGDVSKHVIVPKGIVQALPYIDPRVWSVYAIGPLFDAVKKAAPHAPVLRVWPWYPQHCGQNLHAGEKFNWGDKASAQRFVDAAVDKANPVYGTDVIKRMNANDFNGRAMGVAWYDLGKAGARLDAIDSGPAGLYCWPPMDWANTAHQDAWWGVAGAWKHRMPFAYSYLTVNLSPDWVELMKKMPDYHTERWSWYGPQHWGFKPCSKQGHSSANCAYMYMATCVVAAAHGFLTGAKDSGKGFHSSSNYVRAQMLNVPPPDKNPYTSGLQILALAALGSAKHPAIGGMLAGAGIIGNLLGSRRGGDAGNLWADSFEPMLVPLSLFGSAGPAKWLINQRDVPQLPDWHEEPKVAYSMSPHQAASITIIK